MRVCPACHVEKPLDEFYKHRGRKGVLCNACNTGIGLLRNSPILLIQAAQYLDAPPEAQ
jgi:hypothetical protein